MAFGLGVRWLMPFELELAGHFSAMCDAEAQLADLPRSFGLIVRSGVPICCMVRRKDLIAPSGVPICCMVRHNDLNAPRLLFAAGGNF